MAYQLVTCPETAHLEMIEEEHHPLGRIVLACTRFLPAYTVECARICASRLDRRDHTHDHAEDADPPTAMVVCR